MERLFLLDLNCLIKPWNRSATRNRLPAHPAREAAVWGKSMSIWWDGDGSILRGEEYSYALDATDGACLLHRPSSTWETSYSIHPSYVTERTEIPGDEPGNKMWMITRLDVPWTYDYPPTRSSQSRCDCKC